MNYLRGLYTVINEARSEKNKIKWNRRECV